MALSKKKATVFVISLLIILLVVSPAVFYFLLNFISEKKVSSFADSVDGACKVVYKDVNYDIFSRHMFINGLSVVCYGEEALYFEEIELNHFVSGKYMPSNIQADLRSGTLNADAKVFNKYNDLIKKLGYTALPVYGRITFTLGSVSNEFNLVTFIMNVENIGVIQAEGKTADVTGTKFSELFNKIFTNKSSGFWVSFSDSGLNKRIMEKYAEYTGKDVNSVSMKIENSLYARMNMYEGQKRENFSQIYKYILDDSSISVKVSDKDNMSAVDFLNSFNIESFGGFLDSVSNLSAEIKAGE